MRTAPHLLALALSTLSLVACSDDSALSPVGTWRAVEHGADAPTPIADRTTMTFDADGTLVIVDGGAAAAPVPWSIDGDLLTYQIIEPSETHTVVTPIAIADGHLLLAAMDAQGAVDGVVGTWRYHGSVNAVQLDRTLTLRADHTASLTEQTTPGDGPMTYAATWEDSAPGLRVRIPIGPSTTVSFKLFTLDGVLGGDLFEQI